MSLQLKPVDCDTLARERVYGLLGRVWIREINADLLQDLMRLELSAVFAAAGVSLPDPENLESLAADYCHTLVGPTGHFPPYQSVWEAGRFETTATASVETFLDLMSFPKEQLPGGIMLDHLGVQLWAMSHLLRIHRVATINSEQAHAAADIATAFFAKHLSWPHSMVTQAADQATTRFYRSIFSFTDRFLDSEAE